MEQGLLPREKKIDIEYNLSYTAHFKKYKQNNRQRVDWKQIDNPYKITIRKKKWSEAQI